MQLLPAIIPRSQPLLGPTDVGSEDQVLASDGLGGTYWVDMAAGGGVTDHGALTGLADDDHAQYALLAGRSGGQTLVGGTAAGNSLSLASTSNATKGNINLGSSTVIDSKGRVSIDASGILIGDTDVFKVNWPASIGNSSTKVRFQNGGVDVLSWNGADGWVFSKEFTVSIAANPVTINAGGNYASGTFVVRQSGADRFGVYQHIGAAIYARVGIGNGWSTFTVPGQVNINTTAASVPTLVLRAIASQAANLVDVQDSSGATIAAVKPNGAFQPASLADTAAANGTLYYSTTQSKLVFKDASGVANPLY